MVKINCIFCSFRFNVLHGNVDNKNKARAGVREAGNSEREGERERQVE